MHIVKQLLIAILPFAAFIAITGFLIFPPVLKHVLTTKISGVLHRETSINQIKINPFALSATIKGFKLADPGQNTPSLGESSEEAGRDFDGFRVTPGHR